MAAQDPHKPPDTMAQSNLDNQTRENTKKPSPNPISFASVAKQPRLTPRFSPLNITSKNHGSKNGRPAVSFSAAEYQAGARRFAFSLVAKFSVGRPPIKEIQTALQATWRISGRATISEIWDSRHLLIILDSEQDVTAALACPMRRIGHTLFRLFRWYPDYDPKKESTTTTAWIRLPDLPLPLYDASFIEVIVSTFGVFLDVDDRTKACLSLKFARVCMELDVTKPIPEAVWVNLPNDQGYWQSIVLESNLSYCSLCRIHGHKIEHCRKAARRSAYVPNEGKKIQVEPQKILQNESQINHSTNKSEKEKEVIDADRQIDEAEDPKKDTGRIVASSAEESNVQPTEQSINLLNEWKTIMSRKTRRKNNARMAGNGNPVSQPKSSQGKYDHLLSQYKPKQLPVSIPLAPDDPEDEREDQPVNRTDPEEKVLNNAGPTSEENRLQIVLYGTQNNPTSSQ